MILIYCLWVGKSFYLFHFYRLFGNYEGAHGGELGEALENFTGGSGEDLDIFEGNYGADEKKREELHETMKKEMDNNSVIAAAILVCC